MSASSAVSASKFVIDFSWLFIEVATQATRLKAAMFSSLGLLIEPVDIACYKRVYIELEGSGASTRDIEVEGRPLMRSVGSLGISVKLILSVLVFSIASWTSSSFVGSSIVTCRLQIELSRNELELQSFAGK
jgi:hypothetical protein